MNEFTETSKGGWSTFTASAVRRRWTEHTILATALTAGFVADALCVLGVLHAAFGLSPRPAGFAALMPVLAWLYAGFGTAVFLGTFAAHGLYTRELLLDRRKQARYVVEAWFGSSVLFFGATAFFGTTLVPLSYALGAALTLLALLQLERFLLQKTMRSEAITRWLRQRIVILGWSESAAQLARQSWEDLIYPCEIVGYVEIALQWGPATGTPPTLPCLGAKKDLAAILQHHEIDAACLAGTDVEPRACTSSGFPVFPCWGRIA
jgi:FlaA1/EpsC-like NDP-sugar epimerase